jgi:hypothetical protein
MSTDMANPESERGRNENGVSESKDPLGDEAIARKIKILGSIY